MTSQPNPTPPTPTAEDVAAAAKIFLRWNDCAGMDHPAILQIATDRAKAREDGARVERERTKRIFNAWHEKHFWAGGVDEDREVLELRALFGELFDGESLDAARTTATGAVEGGEVG